MTPAPTGGQLPNRNSERPRGVGHHLLMADGYINVVVVVIDLGNGKERGDRPALDDLETVIDQTPFDVLRASEMRLDPPAQIRQPYDLRVRQRWRQLALRLDWHFMCTA